jgi:methionine aminopeptidase
LQDGTSWPRGINKKYGKGCNIIATAVKYALDELFKGAELDELFKATDEVLDTLSKKTGQQWDRAAIINEL